VTQKAPTPQQLLRAQLERIRPALTGILPKHLTADRMLKVVWSATIRKPSLLECSIPSIVRAVMQAAELGLEIGGLLGEAYLVPYNATIREAGGRERKEKQAQCIVGYRGYIKLARQSPDVSTVTAHAVYKGDVFSVDAANETVNHLPDLFAANRSGDAVIWAYMTVRFKDGNKQIDYMNRDELELVRRRSKAADDGPWVTDFAEMSRKTVVRRGLKYAPISVNLARVIEDEMRIDEDGVILDGAIIDLDPSAPRELASAEGRLSAQEALGEAKQTELTPAKSPGPSRS
jgi:recombination protein RecT